MPDQPDLAWGETRISWTTLGGADGEVYVSRDGAPEHLFARGRAGSVEADLIAAGSQYEFRLYANDSSRRLLARVVITR
jgi:hypothetical protein